MWVVSAFVYATLNAAHLAFTLASNSRVPPPDMVPLLASAIKSESPTETQSTFRRIEFFGQERTEVLNETLRHALISGETALVRYIVNLPWFIVTSQGVDRHGRCLSVHEMPFRVILATMQTCLLPVLDIFLEAGIDIHKDLNCCKDNVFL
jgi:hypothetical protein